jgi:hypothetical protein
MFAFVASVAAQVVINSTPLVPPTLIPQQQAPSTATIETAIRRQLKDPDSAKFVWPYGFVQGLWKTLYGQTHGGLITCGTLNAKNGYGGYNGPEAVVGIIGADGTVTIETDDSYQGTISRNYVADRCGDMGMPVD